MAITEPLLLAVGAVLLLLSAWLGIRIWRRRRSRLERMLDEIAFSRLTDLILPKADEGEIQIDHLLLTARGLLVLHVKDAPGTVFGSDKMQDWTVIAADRRYTFANPQPALYDRVAAVRQVVRDVPIVGRICFLDGAEFSKGVPDMVCGIDELVEEFHEPDSSAAGRKLEAFRPQWDRLVARHQSGEAKQERR